ncbi:threonine/serine dehydratase [Marinobacterium sp. D7]|uniref:threonine ammonia-lyase n=1 Tax=Marinobacterium ramblicola TaxID=2849041 RepID=UPI001C2DB20F|nr:threonine/serine dehydratase [Marinobacterium ramblicola]MBV1790810.1 threonine/serine dehydratase [Marinobacterium ramblicola]
MEKSSVTLEDIKKAAERIRPYIRRTPLLRESRMDKALGCQVYVKPEMLQITGAFKLRGALSKILSLTAEELGRGIITSSSGNHGQACAYAGQVLGIPATVIVPEDTPSVKVENARAMGADVILWDRSYVERWKKVHAEVEAHGYTIVHNYEDFDVIAGQGTIALEIMEDLADVDTVLVPIGGGGLISGIATAIKESKPNIRVIGVQAEACCPYYRSRQNGERTRVTVKQTIADGLACDWPGNNPYPIIEKYVDEIVAVSEESIEEAVRMVANDAKLIAEPSSCVGIAALQSGLVDTRPDEKVCVVLTSGNWNLDMIGSLLKGDHVKGIF